jgi:hypothetical protein
VSRCDWGGVGGVGLVVPESATQSVTGVGRGASIIELKELTRDWDPTPQTTMSRVTTAVVELEGEVGASEEA